MATDTFAESQAEPSTVATDNEVLLNKATLLSDNMRSHELRILEGLRRDLNLPLATQPIRMARIPDDTQATILGTPSTVPVSATQLPARSLRAPVTQQHAEDVIGMDIEMDIGVDIAPRRLVENLLHVAEQLFRLADARNHYRDVNEGDIDVRRGSDGIHLVVDYGAVRKGVSPRAHSAKSDASTVVCRASYDMRAANPLFLPTCSDFARPAVQSWDSMSSQSSDFSGVVNDDNAEEALKDIRDDLPMFKGSLRDASVYGIRSIDDLESAVYLHLWQTAHSYGLRRTCQASLEEVLTPEGPKDRLWKYHWEWDQILGYFLADPAWKNLMRGLREKIYEARKKLTAALEQDFNRRVPMRDLQRALTTAEWQGKNLRAGDIIDALFEGGGIARPSPDLLPIERKCFDDCIKLIKEAIKALPT